MTLFELSYLSVFTLKSLGMDSGDAIYRYAMILTSPAFFACFLHQKHSVKELLTAAILMTLGLFITLYSGQFAPLATFIVIVTSKNVNPRRLIKKMLFTQTVAYFTVIVLWLCRLLPDYSTLVLRGEVWIRRYALGYSHPNTASLQFSIWLILFLLNYRGFFPYAFGVALAALIRFLTGSRTGFIICLAYVFALIVADTRRNFEFRKKTVGISLIEKMICLTPLFFGAASVYLPFLYAANSPIARAINSTLTGRLHLAARYFRMYRVNLFGQTILSYGNSEAYLRLDNGYLNILLRFGLIAFAIFIIAHSYLLSYLLKRNRTAEAFAITVFLLCGLSETYIYNVFFNFTLLYFTLLAYPEKKASLSLIVERRRRIFRLH